MVYTDICFWWIFLFCYFSIFLPLSHCMDMFNFGNSLKKGRCQVVRGAIALCQKVSFFFGEFKRQGLVDQFQVTKRFPANPLKPNKTKPNAHHPERFERQNRWFWGFESEFPSLRWLLHDAWGSFPAAGPFFSLSPKGYGFGTKVWHHRWGSRDLRAWKHLYRTSK